MIRIGVESMRYPRAPACLLRGRADRPALCIDLARLGLASKAGCEGHRLVATTSVAFVQRCLQLRLHTMRQTSLSWQHRLLTRLTRLLLWHLLLRRAHPRVRCEVAFGAGCHHRPQHGRTASVTRLRLPVHAFFSRFVATLFRHRR
jgi:hypothetical protein